MRMLVISFIILLCLIGLWAWFYYGSIEPVTNYYWENLTDLMEIISREDWENASHDMGIYLEKWYEVRDLWIYFVNQKDVDNIDSSIRQVNVYIENREKTLAQAELEHLKVLFYVIDENECLSLENIF